MNELQLSDDEKRVLLAQYSEIHAQSQAAYDSSVRTLSAAGVALSMSLAAAIHALTDTGLAAVSLFLASLGASVTSHLTDQRDMRKRSSLVYDDPPSKELTSNRWTTTTTFLNALAGAALLVGGILLALYIASST